LSGRDAGHLDPTVINGGIINAYGTNARLGAGDWMVVEADESDGTFLKLPADIAIVTNVDAEHLDHFKTFAAVQEAFVSFVENVPFYGFAVMCTDHPIVQRLVGRIEDRRIITCGENPQADVRLAGLDHADGRSRFSVVFRDRWGDTLHEIEALSLPMPGRHNALNATAAVAVAHELGIADELIAKALAGFGGVKRRFTRTGDWNGVAGLGSNLIVRDGGVPGVVIRLGRGFNDVAAEAGHRVRAGAAVPDVRVARVAQEAGIGRARVPARGSGRSRRRAAHERRRLRERDQGRADRGTRRRPRRAHSRLRQCRHGLHVSPLRCA
jgi:hypothetical protein